MCQSPLNLRMIGYGSVIIIPAFLLPFVLLFLPSSESISGRATTYWPGDHFCGTERADGKPFSATDTHIAHRSLPLGTEGFICSESWCTFTVVRDRGPFGAVRPCHETDQGRRMRWKRKCHRWKVLTRPKKGWKYRGKFDLTRPVSDALQHRAFEVVTFHYWPRCLTA